jgi:drug/metabolite transporter (DMT)-like permease
MPSKSETNRLWKHHKGHVYGVLAALTFGGYLLTNRYVYLHYDVDTFQYTTTFLVVGAGFAALSLVFGKKTKRQTKLFQKNMFPIILNGLVAGTGIGLLVFGQAFTTAINASIIATAAVLTTVFFSRLILKENFNHHQMLWVGVMFMGFYFAIVGTKLISFNKGDLIILGAICLLGFTNVFSKVLMRTNTSDFVADVRLVSGGLLFACIGLAIGGSDFLVTSAGLWPIFAGFVFWITIKCMYAAIQFIGPNEAIVLGNSHPFFTALVGVTLLGEPYSLIKFLGSVVVLISVYFVTKKSRRVVTQSAEFP